jgi:hypothetical protein
MFIEGAFHTENRASTLIIHRDVQTKFVDPTTIDFPLCGRYSPKCRLAVPNTVFWNPSGKNAVDSGVDLIDLHAIRLAPDLLASSPKMYTVLLAESKSWTIKPLAFGKLYPVQLSYISVYRGSRCRGIADETKALYYESTCVGEQHDHHHDPRDF